MASPLPAIILARRATPTNCVTFTDELQAILHEIITSGNLDRVHIGLDYFDASINRVSAWVVGARNALRAALLEPTERLRQYETSGL